MDTPAGDEIRTGAEVVDTWGGDITSDKGESDPALKPDKLITGVVVAAVLIDRLGVACGRLIGVNRGEPCLCGW